MAVFSGILAYVGGLLGGAFFLLMLIVGFVLTMIGAGVTRFGSYLARAGNDLVLFVGEHCEDFE